MPEKRAENQQAVAEIQTIVGIVKGCSDEIRRSKAEYGRVVVQKLPLPASRSELLQYREYIGQLALKAEASERALKANCEKLRQAQKEPLSCADYQRIADVTLGLVKAHEINRRCLGKAEVTYERAVKVHNDSLRSEAEVILGSTLDDGRRCPWTGDWRWRLREEEKVLSGYRGLGYLRSPRKYLELREKRELLEGLTKQYITINTNNDYYDTMHGSYSCGSIERLTELGASLVQKRNEQVLSTIKGILGRSFDREDPLHAGARESLYASALQMTTERVAAQLGRPLSEDEQRQAAKAVKNALFDRASAAPQDQSEFTRGLDDAIASLNLRNLNTDSIKAVVQWICFAHVDTERRSANSGSDDFNAASEQLLDQLGEDLRRWVPDIRHENEIGFPIEVDPLVLRAVVGSEELGAFLGAGKEEMLTMFLNEAKDKLLCYPHIPDWAELLAGNPAYFEGFPALVISLHNRVSPGTYMPMLVTYLERAEEIHGQPSLKASIDSDRGLVAMVKELRRQASQHDPSRGRVNQEAVDLLIESQFLATKNSAAKFNLLKTMVEHRYRALSRQVLASLGPFDFLTAEKYPAILLNRWVRVEGQRGDECDFDSHLKGMRLCEAHSKRMGRSEARAMFAPFCFRPELLEKRQAAQIAQIIGLTPQEVKAAAHLCKAIGERDPHFVGDATACTKLVGIDELATQLAPHIDELARQLAPHADLRVEHARCFPALISDLDNILAGAKEIAPFKRYQPTESTVDPYRNLWIPEWSNETTAMAPFERYQPTGESHGNVWIPKSSDKLKTRLDVLCDIYRQKNAIPPLMAQGLLDQLDAESSKSPERNLLSLSREDRCAIFQEDLASLADLAVNPSRSQLAGETVFRNIRHRQAAIFECCRTRPGLIRNLESGIGYGLEIISNNVQACQSNDDHKSLIVGTDPFHLLFYGGDVLERINLTGYSPVFATAVLSRVAASGLTRPEFENFCRLVPPSSDLANDKYAIEYLATYLKNSPAQQKTLIAAVAEKVPSIGNGRQFLMLMGMVDALKDTNLSETVGGRMLSTSKVEMAELSTIVVEEAVKLLADRYPGKLLAGLDPTQLCNFIEKYTAFEVTLKRFDSAEKIPILRVVGIRELLASNNREDQDCSKAAADLEALPMTEDERAVASEYLGKIATRSGLDRILVGADSKRMDEVIDKLHDPSSFEPHIIAEVTPEDKLLEVQRQISLLFGEHTSACFKLVESIEDNTRAQQLAAQGRSLSNYLNGRKNVDEVRGLFPEVSDLDGPELDQACTELYAKVAAQQERFNLFSPLRKLARSSEKAAVHLRSFEEIRNALGASPVSELIEKLGFDVHDSFRTKVFLGELSALRTALGLATLDDNERAAAEKLQKHLEKAEKLTGAVNEFLGQVAALSEKSLAVISAERARLGALVEQTKKSPAEFETIFSEQDPDLYRKVMHARSRLKDSDPVVLSFQEYYRSLELGQDYQTITSVVRSGSEVTTYTYRVEGRFSAQLEATKGQCLDYRSSENSIGNSRHLLSLQDPNRTLLVAEDAARKCRYDQILYLAAMQVEKGALETGLFADIPYTPDGTALSWTKFEGALKFLIKKSGEMNVPLVIPVSTMSGYVRQFEDLCRDQGIEALEATVTATIDPGPTGSVYVEINGFQGYSSSQQVGSKAWIVRPGGAK